LRARRHRGRGAALACAATFALLAPGAPASARTIKVARVQKLAVVLGVHGARTKPTLHAPLVGVVQPARPLTGERTELPVLGRSRGPQGAVWLRVRLPGRPNSHTGWIRKAGTHTASTRWALVVDLGLRRVRVYFRGRAVRTFSAVVGKPTTPTPVGRFFVEESLRITPGYAGGPYALALSARSDVYQEFDGGPGQIALHGVYGIGGVPGTAVSHGCVRLESADMDWLGTHIRPGVPVIVTA
jgi:lipoprotein-anchoring transpeptidase ErfK/SrfK